MTVENDPASDASRGGVLIGPVSRGRRASSVVDDLQRLAMSDYLAGRDGDCVASLGHAYHQLVDRGDRVAAARGAFWLAFVLINNGSAAVAGGWLARAHRLLGAERADCVENGYLLLPDAFRLAAGDQYEDAGTLARQAAEIGDRFGDLDLAALARSVQGRATIRLGDIASGVALLDEAMLAVTTGEVSPVVATTVYCGLIEACQELYDLRRAREWTAALSGWYASRPEVRLNRGRCLVYRAEIMLWNGAWPVALIEAQRAREQLAGRAPQPIAGAAHYLLAELHRLRGRSEPAEAEYRSASEYGREPQPGLALLRLAQGNIGTAQAAIRRAAAGAPDCHRPTLLAAYVEIVLAAGDISAAVVAQRELEEFAEHVATPALRAMAAQAAGGVLLAKGDPAAALGPLRRARVGWQTLEVPYEVARCRIRYGQACRALGDEETAGMELDAARSILNRLGAAALPAVVLPPAISGDGLTTRELEVLRLLATGMTNRAIADQLGLSGKTVARHLSNIFLKLGLRTRSAATAYAYEHHLM